MADLITQPYLVAALEDYNLSATQLLLLPDLAAAASRTIRDWCNRKFTRATYDEIYTLDWHGSIILREFPVNGVSRVAGDPTTVISVSNTDATTNQRATAKLTTTGSADAGLTVTGITLTRVASGVTTTNALLFSSSVTLTALETAIDAIGSGWSATVEADYELWPTADLKAVQGNLPALDPESAEFKIHVTDLAFDLDERLGIVTFNDCNTRQSWERGYIGPTSTVRVIYDAGFDTIPEPVQAACVELVKASLDRLKTDSTLASETDGTYSWSAMPGVGALPPSVLQPLSLYRSERA